MARKFNEDNFDHLLEPPQPVQIGECTECGREIYRGVDWDELDDGATTHADCTDDYLRNTHINKHHGAGEDDY